MDVVAFAPRLPLPGETITGHRVGFFPGGKGLNPAVAAARLGADVRMIGKLGKDAFGEQLSAFAASEGVDLRHVSRSEAAGTGTAIIGVAESGENSIVVIPGANGLLTPEEAACPDFGSGDVLATVLEIPLPTIRAFLQRGREAGAKTILSPAPAVPLDFLDLPDVLVLNETEAAYYLGAGSALSPIQAAARLRKRPEQAVIVTLGAAGAACSGPQGDFKVPGEKVTAVDSTGAGDCFVGALASRLVLGEPLRAAAHFANHTAAISVTRHGAAPSMPKLLELSLPDTA